MDQCRKQAETADLEARLEELQRQNEEFRSGKVSRETFFRIYMAGRRDGRAENGDDRQLEITLRGEKITIPLGNKEILRKILRQMDGEYVKMHHLLKKTAVVMRQAKAEKEDLQNRLNVLAGKPQIVASNSNPKPRVRILAGSSNRRPLPNTKPIFNNAIHAAAQILAQRAVDIGIPLESLTAAVRDDKREFVQQFVDHLNSKASKTRRGNKWIFSSFRGAANFISKEIETINLANKRRA